MSSGRSILGSVDIKSGKSVEWAFILGSVDIKNENHVE